jgi:hypothetical protein
MTPTPPKILSGQEVFDLLMQKIEPELTSEGKKHLSEKYKNETASEHAMRSARYQKAFQEYDRAYEEYMQKQRRDLVAYRTSSFADIEKESEKDRDAALLSLSTSFS